MAIIYRTAGAWGGGLGSNLTPAQVDNNFWEVVERLFDLETAAVATVNQIASISLVGTQLTITMEDFSTFGPFTVPIAAFHWTGAWVASHAYSELDLFYSMGQGVFIVLQDHTSDTTFDPAFVVLGNPAYQRLFPDMISFLNLNDTPNSYATFAKYHVLVNGAETALEFVKPEYPVKFFFKGLPATVDLLYQEKVPFDCEITATDFANGGYAFSVPTALTVDVSLKVNGTTALTFTFHSDGTVDAPMATLTLTAGDLLSFVFQVTTDATFGNLNIALIGNRVPV